MNKILQSFKDKKFRYGTFSTLTILAVIAVLLVVNMLASQINISFDLTKDKQYSLSEESKEALKDLDSPVTIYALFQTGSTDMYIDIFTKLLNQYKSINKNIKLEFKDPYVNPQFVDKYLSEDQDIAEGSIIVESAERFKVIPADKLVTQQIDYNTFQSYVSSIDLEPQVTNAIRYVVNGKSSVIYYLGGHNEMAIPDALKSKLELANFEVRNINLIVEEIPEDCNILFITEPARDWTEEEISKAKSYLENGGKAIFFNEYTGNTSPNLESLLASFGAELQRALVFEGSQQHIYQGSPINIIPDFITHEITRSLSGKYIVLSPMAMPVKEIEPKKDSLHFEPLLVTTDSAYAKTGENVQSMSKEAWDLEGPFNIAAAISDSESGTKIVVVSAMAMLNDVLNNQILGANYDFIINAVNWAADRQDEIFISPKTGDQGMLQMNSAQALLLILFSVIILPGAIIAIGIIVWLKRRNC